MIALSRKRSAGLYLLLAIATVYTIEMLAADRIATVDRGDLLALAITLDCVLFVPLLYYFVMVRRLKWPAVTVAPVLLLSVALATIVIPDNYQTYLEYARYLPVPVEPFVVTYIIRKVI